MTVTPNRRNIIEGICRKWIQGIALAAVPKRLHWPVVDDDLVQGVEFRRKFMAQGVIRYASVAAYLPRAALGVFVVLAVAAASFCGEGLEVFLALLGYSSVSKFLSSLPSN
jgi:hypothetical protein